MFTLGAVFIFAGIVGMFGKAWVAYMDTHDPPRNLRAKVAKMRLDTKKADGQETYTYIVTFFIFERHRYESFEVSQRQFDVILEKDIGTLTCNLQRRKFLRWEIA